MTPVDGVRRLPFRLTPLPDEPLESWLAAMAATYRATGTEMAAAVGLLQSPGGTLRRGWAAVLTGSQVAAIGAATGLDAAAVEAMTPTRFAAAGLVRGPTGSRRLAAASGRFCPACLADSGGRWRLSWRLQFVTVCVRHQSVLLQQCGTCLLPPQRPQMPARRVPRPGRCDTIRPAPEAAGRRCGADLRAAGPMLPASPEMLHAQRLMMQTLSDGSGRFGVYASMPQPAARVFEDVRFLVRVLERRRRNATTAAPEPSQLHARAVQALRSPAALRAAIRAWPVPLAPTLTHCSPQLQEVVGASIGRRRHPAAVLRTSGAFAADPTIRARSVPALLWTQWAARLQPPRADPEWAAMALAAATVVAGSMTTYAAAAELLHLAHPHRHVGVLIGRLAAPDAPPEALLHVLRLAHRLDAEPSPIDYSRRRRMDYRDILPAPLWRQLCAAAQVSAGSDSRHRIARAWLIRHVSGSRPETVGGDPVPWGQLERFTAAAPPRVRSLLEQHAEAFLRAHHIAEPVVWSPPVDPALPAEPAPPVRTVRSWPTRPPAAAARTRASTPSTRSRIDAVDRAWVVRRYVTDRVPASRIAATLGVSPTTVLRILHDTATPIRRGAAARHHPAVADRERLRRFGVVARSGTIAAAAGALSIVPSTLSVQLRVLAARAGGPLFIAARRNHPLILTALGAQLLTEVAGTAYGTAPDARDVSTMPPCVADC
ncbi:MAG: TniQ family protein [Curtobacterium sp.]